MAVTRDATGAGATTTGAACTASHTIAAAGTSTVVIAFVAISVSSNSTATTCSVTYGGTTMTQHDLTLLGSSTNRSAMGIYYLFNPASGAQNCVATPAGASTKAGVRLSTVSYTGVSSVGAAQGIFGLSMSTTSVANGYNIFGTINGAALSAPNQSQRVSLGSSVSGVGDYLLVQDAAGTGSNITFSVTGTDTTSLTSGVSLSPLAASPKVDTLTETFATFDAGKWAKSGGVGAGVSGGAAAVPITTAYERIYSQTTYDLTGSSLIVEVPNPVSVTGSGVYTIVALRTATGSNANEVAFLFGDNITEQSKRISGTQTFQDIAYNATNHRWVKMFESGGTLYFHTAPDGKTWTQVWTTTVGALDITAMYLDLQAGAASGTPGTATFDNINAPPSAAVGGGNFFAFARPGGAFLGGTAALAQVLVTDYATPQLAANAASGKQLVFPANQTYQMGVGPGNGLVIPANCYVLGNNSTLTWANNVMTSSPPNSELLWVNGSGVTIDNLNFDANSQNQNAANWSEQWHCIRVIGAFSNVVVKNCDFTNLIGDGIYVSTSTVGGHVIGPNNTFLANYDNRNGVSIITGDTIEVYGNTFTNMSRNDMPGSIDVEPNSSSEHVAHIDIHDNTIDGGTASSSGTRPGITVALMAGTVVNDIKVRDNIISGTRLIEGVTVIGNSGTGLPFNASTGIVVSGNDVHGIGSTGKYGVRMRFGVGADVINNTFNGVQWGIYNQSACLGASTGNTFTSVTTNITNSSPQCS